MYGPSRLPNPNARQTASSRHGCALHGHYARASDEAYALIREALAASGDIQPGDGELLIRLDSLTAPGAPRPWPHSATSLPPPAPAIPALTSSTATR